MTTTEPLPDNLMLLLRKRGIDLETNKVILMRHADRNYPLYKYIGTRALTLYQSVQNKPCEPGNIIVGFYGNKPKTALLLGMWKIKSRMNVSEAIEKGFLKESFEKPEGLGEYYHELEELDLLNDLRLKLEIEWQGELSWRRELRNGDNRYKITYKKECPIPFTDLANVSLVMAELRIVLDEIEWRKNLSAVCGIYLITDEVSGKQYVGSAYNTNGIWERWKQYAETGHGGNDRLIKLLNNDANRANNFRFTLLEKIDKKPINEVVERENYWKIALASRIHGFNSN